MTQTSTGTDDTSTTDRVRGAGGHVASTAADEASNVKHEVGTQAKNLLGEVRSQLSEQATTQQERAAGGIRTVSDQLRSMADADESGGVASSLVSQAASRAGDVAGWLESRDPSGLLDDIKSFARRRPGVFIAVAAGAGIVAGRLAKSLASGNDESSSASGSGAGQRVASATQAQTGDTTPQPADFGYVAPTTATYADTPTYADTANERGNSGDVR